MQVCKSAKTAKSAEQRAKLPTAENIDFQHINQKTDTFNRVMGSHSQRVLQKH